MTVWRVTRSSSRDRIGLADVAIDGSAADATARLAGRSEASFLGWIRRGDGCDSAPFGV
jgi:hypothetical protein